MKVETRIRKIARAQSQVFITTRKRGKFIVTGPDGKGHPARTRKEALANLLARIRSHPASLWAIRIDDGEEAPF